jgi:hypothetical protein
MKTKFLSSILLVGSCVYIHAQFSGNVGINTTSPTATLNVKGKGNTNSTQSFKLENSDGVNLLTVNDNGTVSGSAVSNLGGGSGTNGFNALVRTSAESSGTNCSVGGIKIESGQDTNNNSILDNQEIISTRYVCNGSNGTNGAGIANGTAGGQIYLTGSTSPFSPQLPQSVTGDISFNASGSSVIVPNAVVTGKISDLAVSTAKLANASVTISKISATGSANANTYLRGDGQWATPSASVSSSVLIGVLATNAVAQVIPVGSATSPVETNVTFSSYPSPDTGSFDGSVFTATSAGIYLVESGLVGINGNTIFSIRLGVKKGSTVVAYGSVAGSSNYPAGTKSSSTVSAVVSLAANETISIIASNASTSLTASTSTDGTTHLSIVKL